MAENYRVKQGDCISSIAFEKGFFPDTIWNHPDNKDLKEKRKDMNVLLPGDMVFIPDRRLKEISEPTNQVYKYKCKNIPAMLMLELLDAGDPIKNAAYRFEIEGKSFEGKTDSQGRIRIPLIPNARKALLLVEDGARRFEYELDLGHLDPVEEVIGFKKRLKNLGYEPGSLNTDLGLDLAKAIRCFEADNKLDQTGEMSDSNRKKLVEIYGR